MTRYAFVKLAVTLLLLPGSQFVDAAEPLQAGVAGVDVTPPVGYRMSGYFNERLNTGVKDSLHARALVLRQGDRRAAIVVCDLMGVPRSVTGPAREQASEATGIPAENIAIAATHSHTGPMYFDALRNYYHRRAVERLGRDPYETIDYSAELTTNLVKAIREANDSLHPIELAAGNAHENRLSFNRRFHMRDGTVRFNPGERSENPNILRPAGPIDPQVGIVTITEPGATKPSAMLAAFALHLDTLSGTEYSADFPHVAEVKLRATFGPEFDFIFGAGTCGDINHLDVSAGPTRQTAEIGELLAETIGGAVATKKLPVIAAPSLAVRHAIIEAPLQHYPPAEVAAALENMALVGGRELSFLDQVQAYKITFLQEFQGSKTIPLEVQAFRLSDDVAIVTLPSEVFVEIGLAIKAASPFPTTIVISMANDYIGYIPTRKACAEGSYETVNSIVEPGAGEMLVEAAARILKELK